MTMFHPLSAMNLRRRNHDIDTLAGSQVDVVVIGGGITGVGIALDAVTRGLSTVLLEKHDLAFGTSRWSSKLIHGGLRYLAKAELDVAYHSAIERGILMETTAPHLIKAVPQVAALGSDTNLVQKITARLGFLAGDVLRIAAGTKSTTLPRSRFANKSETLRLCPVVRQQGLVGSWLNYDGQMVDDARVVTTIARTAARQGAAILTYCDVGKATGREVEFIDRIAKRTVTIKAHAVINATGVWAGAFDENIKIRPARGSHLVLDAELLGNPTGALTVALPGSISRYLFILPAPHGRVYLGLTDEDSGQEIPDVPTTPESDIDFLLDNINRALNITITRSDVLGTFTGLRPLLETGEAEHTADISRRHAITESKEQVISVVGGKFTEYRLMAEQTVDFAVKARRLAAGACRTKNFPLLGAPGHMDYMMVSAKDLYGLPQGLVDRHGYAALEVMEAAADHGMKHPLETVAGTDITRAEVAFAVTHEAATCVADILERRTRLAMVPVAPEIQTEVANIIQELI